MESYKGVSELKYRKTSKLPSCYLLISDFEVLYDLIHLIYANDENIDVEFNFTFIYKKNLHENLTIKNSKDFSTVEKALDNMFDSIYIYTHNSPYKNNKYKRLEIRLHSNLNNELYITSNDRAWAEYAEQNIKHFFLQRKNNNWIFYNYFVISIFIYLPVWLIALYLSKKYSRMSEIVLTISIVSPFFLYLIYWPISYTVIKRYFPITHIIKSDKDKTVSKIAKWLIGTFVAGLVGYFLWHFFYIVFEKYLHIF